MIIIALALLAACSGGSYWEDSGWDSGWTPTGPGSVSITEVQVACDPNASLTDDLFKLAASADGAVKVWATIRAGSDVGDFSLQWSSSRGYWYGEVWAADISYFGADCDTMGSMSFDFTAQAKDGSTDQRSF